jgi:hypothetical protein
VVADGEAVEEQAVTPMAEHAIITDKATIFTGLGD